MSKKRLTSLEQIFTEVENEIVTKCVQCGYCISICPVFWEGPCKDNEPEDIAQKLYEALKTGTYSDEAYFTAFGCTECDMCHGICPGGIYPRFFRQVTRNKLAATGNPPPPGFLSAKPNLPEVLQSIRIKSSDAGGLKKAPPSPEQKDVVVFTGCASLAAPGNNFALVDILDKMDIDFAALAEGGICCGRPNLFAGDLKSAEDAAENLIKRIQYFSPKKLILACPSCYDMVKNTFPRFLSFDFEVEFLSSFLFNNLGKLKFTTQLNKKITLHDPCPLARGFKDHTSARKVIATLPGVELKEMAHSRENALCCGGLFAVGYPDYGRKFGQKLLQEAQQLDIDALVNLCPGCHHNLRGQGADYSFELSDLPSLINEAMGDRQYED